MKGADFLAQTGYIRARAYTSNARIPLEDVAITVTDPNGTLMAMRLTDESGLTDAIPIQTPDRSDSQKPEPFLPFTAVHLTAKLRGYEQIEIENLQVFPETVTLQDLEMIPLSELPNRFDMAENFVIPPQNL